MWKNLYCKGREGGSLSSKEGHETGGMETALHPLHWRPNKDYSDLIYVFQAFYGNAGVTGVRATFNRM